MKIVCLVENTQGQSSCGVEHGLSYYIETEKHKILMDAGDTDLVLKNAELLGVDLAAVDIAFLSHGHHDHGGGLRYFAQVNSTAKIYMQSSAAGQYFSDELGNVFKYIALPEEVKALPQIEYVDGSVKIDDELEIMAGIGLAHPLPSGCLRQKMIEGGEYVQDDFRHEQCLVVTQNGKYFLFSGCAHHGILNIMERFREVYGKDPDYVFSGMHMMKQAGYDEADIANIEETSRSLQMTDTVYYTGHCTSIAGFEIMQGVMGDQIRYMHCGDTLTF